jgi:hypothetical protein
LCHCRTLIENYSTSKPLKVLLKNHKFWIVTLLWQVGDMFISVYISPENINLSILQLCLWYTVNSNWYKLWGSLCLALYIHWCNAALSNKQALFVIWYNQIHNLLQAEKSGDRIPVGARFSAHVQTDSGAHPTSYTVGTGSLPGVKQRGYGVDHLPHLGPRLKKE